VAGKTGAKEQPIRGARPGSPVSPAGDAQTSRSREGVTSDSQDRQSGDDRRAAAPAAGPQLRRTVSESGTRFGPSQPPSQAVDVKQSDDQMLVRVSLMEGKKLVAKIRTPLGVVRGTRGRSRRWFAQAIIVGPSGAEAYRLARRAWFSFSVRGQSEAKGNPLWWDAFRRWSGIASPLRSFAIDGNKPPHAVLG